MITDFLQFVKSIRIGDAIGIEYGYQKHSKVFEALGKNKYVDIFYSQQERLYRDMVYSRLQELRLNRVVCRVHGSKGKRCVAHDEFLEHGNKICSNFPMPGTALGFAFQSQYVGISLQCRQFSDLWYTTMWKGDVSRDYNNCIQPGMTPERQLLYELFRLTKTHRILATRLMFSKDWGKKLKSMTTVALKRSKIESTINEALRYGIDALLVDPLLVYIT